MVMLQKKLFFVLLFSSVVTVDAVAPVRAGRTMRPRADVAARQGRWISPGLALSLAGATAAGAYVGAQYGPTIKNYLNRSFGYAKDAYDTLARHAASAQRGLRNVSGYIGDTYTAIQLWQSGLRKKWQLLEQELQAYVKERADLMRTLQDTQKQLDHLNTHVRGDLFGRVSGLKDAIVARNISVPRQLDEYVGMLQESEDGPPAYGD